MKFRNLYVHTPFCETKCHYCDFFSLPEGKYDSQSQIKVYRNILDEFRFYRLGELETIFLGGGTPSLAPESFLEALFGKLDLDSNCEVTLEANPSSVTPTNASHWKSLGVNRVSLGVQALSNERLEWLGRVHSKAAAYKALEAVHNANIERVSIDYIVGVPEQSLSQIESELGELLSKFPAVRHVSAYLLTLQTTNPKLAQLPNEEAQLQHLRMVRDVLAAHGLLQYEISNFAEPGFEARHNLNYWNGGSYLGIGPSAHSFDSSEQLRWKNKASLSSYCEDVENALPPIDWKESLDREQRRLEYLMLRLRTSAGIVTHDYSARFGRDLAADNDTRILQWEAAGLVSRSQDQIRLMGDGYFLSDSIIGAIR
ncbi:MAG TPA: radical SAM family heme chaperone HemW [Oligoflexia bacterium]|nr:radical SAM family heme chaperone HemW [Oligoflexia bacterium]